MSTLKNVNLRSYAKKNGVPLWLLAQTLGISEPTMTRHLRQELSSVEEARLKSVIDKIASREVGA